MRNRCRTKYAGRFSIDPHWDSYENFLADMGECPAGKTLDRRDNTEGYNKNNCRWATPVEQALNTRRNRFITFAGETLSITHWERKLGFSRGVIAARMQHSTDPSFLLHPLENR